MTRIIPILMVVFGIGLHFNFCEWRVSESRKMQIDYNHEQVIVAHHRHGHQPRRGLPNHVVLLARSGVDRNDALYYGVVGPGLFLGCAGLVLRFYGDNKRESACT